MTVIHAEDRFGARRTCALNGHTPSMEMKPSPFLVKVICACVFCGRLMEWAYDEAARKWKALP